MCRAVQTTICPIQDMDEHWLVRVHVRERCVAVMGRQRDVLSVLGCLDALCQNRRRWRHSRRAIDELPCGLVRQ